jgi:hypothetical protein
MRESDHQSYVSTSIQLKWNHEIDKAITSISYVMTERNKNVWHQPDG